MNFFVALQATNKAKTNCTSRTGNQLLHSHLKGVETNLPDDVLAVKPEQKADGEGPAEGLAVMVHFAGPVLSPVISEVKHHVPQCVAKEDVVETLTLVEVGHDFLRFAVRAEYLLLSIVEFHRYQQCTRKTPRMHGTLVVEEAASHHELLDEWEDAEDLRSFGQGRQRAGSFTVPAGGLKILTVQTR
jgi:hypothetical protein